MMRAIILAFVAAVAAENCGGSMAVDPRYCTARDANGEAYCDSAGIQVGDTVPLRIRVSNKANFEDSNGDPVYVPGTIVAGKQLQIVFVCLDGPSCSVAAGDVLEYTNVFTPSGDATGSTFAMGPAVDMTGIDFCKDFPNAATACGHVTVGQDIAIDGDETVGIGMVFMKAVKRLESSFLVHISGQTGILLTTGGICTPKELSASGAGTAQAEFGSSAPPPPPPQCEVCGTSPCTSSTCAACAFPFTTPSCIASCGNCAICKQCDTAVCKACVAGTTVGDQCTPCANCVVCDPCDTDICKACAAGTFFGPQTECTECASCITCDAAVCKACVAGTTVGDRCTPCTSCLSPPPPPPPQCEVCGQAPCSTTCAACAFPFTTPSCIASCSSCTICKVCDTAVCKACAAGTLFGGQCAECSSCVVCSPPPSPPPPPPPPAPTPKYACITYNKCHNCEMLPPGACLYAGEINGPCYTACDDLPEMWVFSKKWGSCSSACPVSVSKDPHLHLPHGGRADFRGKPQTVFNLLSAKDVTLNVLFEASDFAWATRLVHGTKMGAAYWVLRTESGKVLTVEYEAAKYGPVAILREDGHQDVLVRPGQPAVVVDDIEVVMVSAKTLSVATKKWRFSATSSPFPFGKLEANKDKVLLDMAIQPLYNVDGDVVAPHGIIGQAYDGDDLAVDGKIDGEKKGESTTTAQAEGAIEGSWEDYMMAGKFATDYKYSRFDAAAAAHRDVSKLTGAKKAASAVSVVGAVDVEGDNRLKLAA